MLKQKIKNVFRNEENGRIQQGEFPFNRTTLNTVSSDENIYSVNTGIFLKKVYDKQGTYLRSFYYPFNNSPINYETYFEGFDLDLSDLPDFEFPETWPAIDDMIMDDHDRLWISTIINDKRVFEWWVVSKKGELLGKFIWPRNKQIKIVKKGYLFVLEEDSDTGIDKIVKYKINFNKL